MPLPSSFGQTLRPPLLEQDYVGFGNTSQMQAASSQAAAPLVAAAEKEEAEIKADSLLQQQGREKAKQNQEKLEERRQAMEFQKILQGGPQTMFQFADEVAKQDPNLGGQLKQEAQSLSLLFQNPKFGGEQAEDIMLGFYKGAFDRMNHMGLGKPVDDELAKLNRDLKSAQIKAYDALTKLRDRTPGDRGGKGKPNDEVLATVLKGDLAFLETQQTRYDELLKSRPADRYSEEFLAWKEEIDDVSSLIKDAVKRIEKNKLLASSVETLNTATGGGTKTPTKDDVAAALKEAKAAGGGRKEAIEILRKKGFKVD